MNEPLATDESAVSFLEMAFRCIGNDAIGDDAGDHGQSGRLHAEIHGLKAKFRIVKEEMEQVLSDYKKDHENTRLNAKKKGTEKECVSLAETTSVQQTRIEKHRSLLEESWQKCASLQQQEIHNLKNSQKETLANHTANEVLEEAKEVKTQLNNIKQINKQTVCEKHQSKQNQLAENEMVKTHKKELIMTFKKQRDMTVMNFRKKHKLTDIHKRPKRHFADDKLLSFTKEEFKKALNWENFESHIP